MVGTAGFEPTDGGTKNRCLTTWRRPKIFSGFVKGNYSNKKEGGFLGVGFTEVNKLLKFLL